MFNFPSPVSIQELRVKLWECRRMLKWNEQKVRKKTKWLQERKIVQRGRKWMCKKTQEKKREREREREEVGAITWFGITGTINIDKNTHVHKRHTIYTVIQGS